MPNYHIATHNTYTYFINLNLQGEDGADKKE